MLIVSLFAFDISRSYIHSRSYSDSHRRAVIAHITIHLYVHLQHVASDNKGDSEYNLLAHDAKYITATATVSCFAVEREQNKYIYICYKDITCIHLYTHTYMYIFTCLCHCLCVYLCVCPCPWHLNDL